MEEERRKIQEQLGALREEGLREYMMGRLEAITSREVISEVIDGFISSHEQEFMATIADSILEAKLQYKELKEALRKTKE